MSRDNQKIKADKGKPQCRLVPTEIIRCIARVREYGLNKYGSAECWRDVEVERYQDAMYRHLLAYIEKPNGVDEESGLPHLWHLACNAAFLCELQKLDEGKGVGITMQINPCKYCGHTPLLSDVGGNSPYYEISCKCEKGVVVGSPDNNETVACWNILN